TIQYKRLAINQLDAINNDQPEFLDGKMIFEDNQITSYNRDQTPDIG
ncbi:17192_t:CDS:1, partial [Racocetra persica]